MNATVGSQEKLSYPDQLGKLTQIILAPQVQFLAQRKEY